MKTDHFAHFARRPVAAAAALLWLAPAALAQTAPAPAQTDTATATATPQQQRTTAAAPETIIVTATRRNETAAKLPFNISAITEETLREENITDIKKLISLSPAINAPENPARFADSVTVRGLNVSPVNANNLEQFVKSTLSYYLDDTSLPYIGIRIKDIARVETLLGPQGTLYGAGALGGAVRYITNKPRLGKVEAKLNTSFWKVDGGELSNDIDAVFNLPLGDRFAARLSLARLDEGGWFDRVSNPPWRTGSNAWTTQPNANQNVYKNDNWQEVETGRLQLLWQPTKAIQLRLSHAKQDQLANGTGAVSRLPLQVANARNAAELLAAWQNPQRPANQQPCIPNCTYANESNTPYAVNDRTYLSRYPEFARRKFDLTQVDLDWDLGFATLHSSTGRYKDRRRGQADYASQGWAFYAPENPDILNGYDLGGSIKSNRSAYMTFDNEYSGNSHETRLTSKGGQAIDWLLGYYRARQNSNLRFSEVLPGMDAYINSPDGVGKASPSPLPDVGYSEDLGSQYKEDALFGEATLRVNEKLRITAGARAFNYTDTALGEIIDYAGGAVNYRGNPTNGENGNTYYKLNAAYQFTPDMLGYATYSEGFRRGGTNPFRQTGSNVLAPDAREYFPDSTENYEIGLKGYLLGRQLYIETALFKIDWKDTQTYRSQTISGFPVNGTANGPDSTSKGWEFSSRWKVSHNWQLTYSTTTVEARWKDTKRHCIFVVASNSTCRTWTAGGLLGGAPKWKHNFGVRFQHTFDNDVYVWTSLSARYVGPIQVDRSDSPEGNIGIAKYKSYTRYNASAGLSWGALDATLWVSNLTNLRLVSSVQAAGIMGPREISPQFRTIGLNLSYRFK